MILQDLFESNMKRVLDAMREIKTLDDDEFAQVHAMSKGQWVRAYWPVIKSVAADDAEITRHLQAPDAHLFHEGAMKDLHTELAEKYQELAPKIEKYKDNFLAGELYDALEAIAVKHNAELEFKRMLAGARNHAHMDYDTNPGGFQNWFWYLPFADEQLDEQGVAEMDTYPHPKSKEGKRLTKAIRDPNAPEVKPQPVKKTVKDATKILNKEFHKSVKEGGYDNPKQGVEEEQLDEKQDACYHKVKSRYKVWPSAYASGALVQCRKKGAANWGNKSKK